MAKRFDPFPIAFADMAKRFDPLPIAFADVAKRFEVRGLAETFPIAFAAAKRFEAVQTSRVRSAEKRSWMRHLAPRHLALGIQAFRKALGLQVL